MPYPPFCALVAPPCAFVVVKVIAPALAVCACVVLGLGWCKGWGKGGEGGGLMGFGVSCARLPEYVQPGAIFPLWMLSADTMRRNPGSPDAPMHGPHQSDVNTTIDVTTRLRVGLPLR